MRRLIIAFVLIAGSLIACNKEEVVCYDCDNIGSPAGTWVMKTVYTHATNTAISKPAAENGDVTITLVDTDATHGILSGSTPMNTIFNSAYNVRHALGSVQFNVDDLMISKRTDTEWGYLFATHIRTAITYRFNNPNELLIVGSDATLVFSRVL